MTLPTLSPQEAARRLRDGTAVLADIREADERARARIAGSAALPLSRLAGAAAPGRADQAVIFHCLSGARTAQNAAALAGTAAGRPALILEGGLRAWQAAGLPVESDARAPMPIMRQVQIVAGGLVVLGALGGALWHPALHAVSAFIGAGLVFSGVTGTCGMGALLGKMPWNGRRPA
ncbi:rhodanese family protein [Roseomonas marmotae]|uniref:Rhodanese family protein n=1 Tax=Roseomonas marmotae TaxID=2768161 RepID=A0ABS3KH87_9PROT|nr:rhodanese family protein [Roseomonas marmotae]MBO1076819.1 rhodanese family protein [Roseomonas marmotae]QTI78719.1 rhodanese family protein [Roseomonas marmotae]